ncbi:MAG: glycosyltransferase [bacterium]
MITIIITSYKEAKTIGQAIKAVCDPIYSGFSDALELITVIPDQATITAAAAAIQNFSKIKYLNIRDPLKGKPYALNLALRRAKGEIIVLTDGDVYFEAFALKKLLDKLEKNPEAAAVTGRPIAADPKTDLWRYIGNLLADAAHHKRMATMTSDATGKSLKLVSRTPNFFVLSGYILAFRKISLQLPVDCLVEDAYLSYVLFNQGHALLYEPQAQIKVKYPLNIRDWYAQKLRSVGGYLQLWKYGVIKKDTKVRNFWKELEYFWFPIKYATNLKELIWSLELYPLRLWLWIRIFIQQRILKTDLIGKTGWQRIESTK